MSQLASRDVRWAATGSRAVMPRHDRSPSLRSTVALWTVAFGAIAIAIALALVYATHRMRQGTVFVVRDTQSLAIARSIETDLEGHAHFGSLLAATGDPEFARTRRMLERDIEAQLARASGLSANERERELLETARLELRRALAAGRALEDDELRSGEVLRRTQDQYERARDAMTRLNALNQAQVTAALQESAEVDRLATTTGITAALVIALGLIALVAGLRRMVTSPLRTLAGAIATREDRSLAVDERGAREVRAITRAINEMSAALARDRDDRLAFIAGVAHDLRTPLSALKMAVVQARRAPEAADRALVIADRQVEHLTRMIGDLLDTARIEAGELELRIDPLDIRTVAREVVELQRPKTDKHEIVLVTPDEPVPVNGDALRIEQVIDNLVSNAIKYSPAGGRIDVRIEQDRGQARIVVADHGIGMAAEEIPLVFTAFRRRPAGQAVASGVGMGLSIVRRIVEAHGGTVEVESKVGVGSTFQVSLPAADPSRTASPESIGAGDAA